ncbi:MULTISPECIES: hypothetical protein [Streptomyces]|uniref:Translation initiation factor IF-2 n=1 Tax=Streptomyces canarius TaxID=285453 RepID=A0ABQ3CIB2_9ACTN|nr:hypothetical protein [Streptomyces canarius]GHA10007.1 hypothetical protein GCM10010345_13410 [Streptomyces canarius]
MTDRTSGSGGDRHRPQRLSRGDEWTPEQESEQQRDEWTPGDAAPGRRTPRRPLPEERLPGEPGARRPADGGVPGAGPGGGGRLPGSAGPGREGLTGDDRTPKDTPQPPPGPAGVPESGRSEDIEPSPGPVESPASGMAGSPGFPGGDPRHGSEGLRPGTEEPGPETPGAQGRASQTYRGRDRDAGGPEWAGEEEGVMPDNGLGAPSVGEVTGREARMTEARAADTWPTGPGSTAAPGRGATGTVGTAATAPSGTGAPLLPHEETEQWERRLREVVTGFVDEPRQAVEQADRALEEIAARFTEAVTRRRRTLRMSWEGTEGRGPGAETDTEQLRLALRDYRELAGRLLHG